MKETNCNNPSCGKKLKHTEGRRPKKYCSPKCRISHHLKQKKSPKFVQLETHNKKVKELQDKLQEALSSKIDYQPTTEKSFDGKELNNYIADELPMTQPVKEENKPILARIMEIQKELKNPPKNPLIGIKTWKKVRENEIAELEQKLNS